MTWKTLIGSTAAYVIILFRHGYTFGSGDQSEMLRLERFASLGRMLLTGQIDTIIHDHAIAPGSGYDKAIA